MSVTRDAERPARWRVPSTAGIPAAGAALRRFARPGDPPQPGLQSEAPSGPIERVFLHQPAPNLGGLNRQEQALLREAVVTVLSQLLDRQLFPVEVPDLRDLQFLVDVFAVHRGR